MPIDPLEQATEDAIETTTWETLTVRKHHAVLFVEIAAAPMNLMGPALVRDLASLIRQAEQDEQLKVLRFRSADPHYFIAHVDVTRVQENRAAAAGLRGATTLGELFRHLSTSRLISIAQIEGRVRGVGSEFVLACDMRFAARETAIFGQFEVAFGSIPGAGGAQHLTRAMGRGRALEVMLSADDYDAELAERYGWINRALPRAELNDFVEGLAERIAKFPKAGLAAVKDRVNALTLPPPRDLEQDAGLFLEGLRAPEAQARLHAALEAGLQTRNYEMALGNMLAELPEHA